MSTFYSLDDAALIALLQSGAVGVLPTDTIYGLAAVATNPQAVARLGRLKQHGQKPGTVIAANVEQLIQMGVDEAAVRRVAHLWPNSLSIELPVSEGLSHLYQNGPHRAFRVIASPELQPLLLATGPLLTSSANPHTFPNANGIAEAQAYFGDDVDFYVEGGDRSNHPASTVAVLHADGSLEVVRQGAVILNEKGGLA